MRYRSLAYNTKNLKRNQISQQRLGFGVIRFWSHLHGGYSRNTEQRCGLWEEQELRLEPWGMCKFKGMGEHRVSSGKARKMGVKPGQDVKEIKVEDGPFFFPTYVWPIGADSELYRSTQP